MTAPQFFIQTVKDREVIFSRNGQLKLEIYNLNEELFKAPADQLTMYGDDNGRLLAFVAPPGHTRIREITRALTWYAQHIQNSELVISTIDPRPTPRLKIVR